MARADLLKKLFRSYKLGDQDSFMEAALSIVDEEKKKRHVVLANDLTKILMNGKPVQTPGLNKELHPLPKDSDRQTQLLDVRRPDRYLSEIVMDSETRDMLNGVIQEFIQWDILESNGLLPSHKLLFCGPPGCGKTVTAEAIAAELGVPLLYVRFDAVVSSLLGETSANLRKVFDYASRGTWVILFDEFDAIGRSRDDDTEHGELKRVVNSFLQLLDQFNGRSIIVAATNHEQALDTALWRRFDEITRFSKPTPEQILDLLRLFLGRKAPKMDILKRFSGQLNGATQAEVERVCKDALKRSVLNGDVGGLDPYFLEVAYNRHIHRKQVLEGVSL